MKDAFLSHVEEDRDIAEAIAANLEASGCSAWYYERDSVPGSSYLLQTMQAIEEAKCFLFLVSPTSIARHRQVDRELIRAHEADKHIIPILIDIGFRDLRERRPEWCHAIGANVGVELTSESVQLVMPRLLRGLQALGLPAAHHAKTPEEAETSQSEPEAAIVVEDSVTEDLFDDEEMTTEVFDSPKTTLDDRNGRDFLPATIIHEHFKVGFLADVIVTENDDVSTQVLRVAFTHQLLGSNPRVIEFPLRDNTEPVEYYRFTNAIQGYPLLLRVYWLGRLPMWSAFRMSFGVTAVPSVRVKDDPDAGLVNADAIGVTIGEKFRSVIVTGRNLPHVERKRVRTTRDNQNAITITPAVRRSENHVVTFPKFRLSVPLAPAGVAWMEYSFRIDADGRFTIIVRDPLAQMRIRDLIIVQ